MFKLRHDVEGIPGGAYSWNVVQENRAGRERGRNKR